MHWYYLASSLLRYVISSHAAATRIDSPKDVRPPQVEKWIKQLYTALRLFKQCYNDPSLNQNSKEADERSSNLKSRIGTIIQYLYNTENPEEFKPDIEKYGIEVSLRRQGKLRALLEKSLKEEDKRKQEYIMHTKIQTSSFDQPPRRH